MTTTGWIEAAGLVAILPESVAAIAAAMAAETTGGSH
jgi:hypothetical protein